MPQPPLEVSKYLSTPLPHLRESYPPGTGGTGPRSSWPEGTLQAVQVIQDFNGQVQTFLKSLPGGTVKAHPNFKYPKFVQAITTVPSAIKSPADLQKCLSTLPLAAVSSVLTALDADPEDLRTSDPAQSMDKAGYESDGAGEEPELPKRMGELRTRAWYWKFNKSPMGSGEFYLQQQGSDDVKMIVRTINSAALTLHDWEEFVVTGPYRYSTKSKASWYWSRQWGASKRLNCHHFVLTDWQRWVFGTFDDEREHGWVSPVKNFDAKDPSVMQALLFWARSASGHYQFIPDKKDVADMDRLFPDNPARRVSISGKSGKSSDGSKIKAANESDIEESDAEGA